MNDFTEVRRLLQGAVGPVFPAAQLLVVDEDTVVLDEVAGACTKSTIFDLASLTKALCTTTLVMRLVERGALRLTDPLRPGATPGDGVTIELALCHATGLPPWRPLWQSAATLAAGSDEARRAVLDAARREPLETPPGTRAAYSDLGFILLGDAVERAFGCRLDQAWAALAAGDATFHPDPAACAPTETFPPPLGTLRGVVHDDNARAMGGVAGHAGLFGNARAVSTIVRDLVRAWRTPDSASTTTLVRHDTIRRFWLPSPVPHSTWCLGWDRPSPLGSGHASSAGTRWPRDGVGHLGYTGCSLWVDPPRARWVILLTNRVHPTHANDAIKAFRPLIHDAIVSALDD